MFWFRQGKTKKTAQDALLTAQSLPLSNCALLVLSDNSSYAALTLLNLAAELGLTSGCVDRANLLYASFISSNVASDSTPSVAYGDVNSATRLPYPPPPPPPPPRPVPRSASQTWRIPRRVTEDDNRDRRSSL